MKTKLGPKLKAIFELIPNNYDVIWDTCCDHGKLGLACLEFNMGSKVVFVDQVPSIMDELEKKILNIKNLPVSKYDLQTRPAQDIVLEDKKNLVCIAGVGGDEVIKIIEKLEGQFDLLISPQYHLLEVRRFLKELGFKSLKEDLVFEGKFGRELLLISKAGTRPIDPIGSSLFEFTNEKHRIYIQGIVEHLKRNKSYEGLELYEALLGKFTA